MVKVTALNKAHQSIEALFEDILKRKIAKDEKVELLLLMDQKVEALVMINQDYKKDLQFLGFPVHPSDRSFTSSCRKLSSAQQVTLLKYIVVRDRDVSGTDILDKAIVAVKTKLSEPFYFMRDDEVDFFTPLDNFIISLSDRTSATNKSALQRLTSRLKVVGGSQTDSLERQAIHEELVPLLRRIQPFCTAVTLPVIMDSIVKGDMVQTADNSQAFMKYYTKVANDRSNPKNKDLYQAWESLKTLSASIFVPELDASPPPQARSQAAAAELTYSPLQASPEAKGEAAAAEDMTYSPPKTSSQGLAASEQYELERAITESLKPAQENEWARYDDKKRQEQEDRDIKLAKQKPTYTAQLEARLLARGRQDSAGPERGSR